MPKNIIPKDNIPKIVEVREIESEIPSYEEFLKNYQSDQKVNDSYENEVTSYNDLGTPKASGSCFVCYKDTNWTNLYLACPTDYCGSTNTSYWYHSNSGYLLASSRSGCGRLEISNKGEIKCQGCGTSGRISNWKFACSNHPSEYRTVSNFSFRRSLMAANDFSGMITDLQTYLTSHR